MKSSRVRKVPSKSEPLSLRPLSFNEAVADLLKVKPPAKPPKKKMKPKKK